MLTTPEATASCQGGAVEGARMSEAKTEAAEKKPKSRKLLLMIIVAVLLLGGAGGGFFWWRGQQAAKAAEHEKGSAKDRAGKGDHGDDNGTHEQGGEDLAEAEDTGVLPFEPYIVNLADPGASRYLKADIRLLVSEVEDLKHLEENQAVMMRVRSAILEHLSQQTSDQVVTPEGKAALKKEIRQRASKILQGHAKVADVLFNEFVVQF
jgi:flagellar FliL protein